MSQADSANITIPSRRLFLAAGPAAAVFGALHVTAAAQSPLVDLIGAQRAALSALEEWCDREDEPSEDDPAYPAIYAEWLRACDHEDAAMTAVCAYSARTMDEANTKAAFLANHLMRGELGKHQFKALLNSFLA